MTAKKAKHPGRLGKCLAEIRLKYLCAGSAQSPRKDTRPPVYQGSLLPGASQPAPGTRREKTPP